jgi:hypothetical protein
MSPVEIARPGISPVLAPGFHRVQRNGGSTTLATCLPNTL